MKTINRRTFLSVAGAALASSVVRLDADSSGPSTIMLIRHGEDLGEQSFHLNPKGMKRAQALPRLFESRLPKPQVIVATHASKMSNRPIETVEPLARALHLEIDNRFKDDDYAILARDLLSDARFSGKVVLVCWHHGKLPKLAKALGAKDATKWPDNVFDRVWVIDYKKSGHARLEDIGQKLLDGDS